MINDKDGHPAGDGGGCTVCTHRAKRARTGVADQGGATGWTFLRVLRSIYSQSKSCAFKHQPTDWTGGRAIFPSVVQPVESSVGE